MSVDLERSEQSEVAKTADPAPKLRLIERVEFGAVGNSAMFQLEGWSFPEEAWTWTVGHRSMLLFKRPSGSAKFTIELDLHPYVVVDALPSQRLAASVNGRTIGALHVFNHSVIGFDFELEEGEDRITICFEHPDAARPCDYTDNPDERLLAFCFFKARLYLAEQHGEALAADAAYPVSDEPPLVTKKENGAHIELFLRLQSLGHDCELGVIQRAFHAEPLGLLRFGTTPLGSLMAMLQDRFKKIGEPGSTKVEVDQGGEYVVIDTAYGSLRHTFVKKDDMPAEQLLERELSRLAFLREKLIEDLEESDKIFVFKEPERQPVASIVALSQALRHYNQNNVLLWVSPYAEIHPPATVEPFGDGIIKAYMPRHFREQWDTEEARQTWLAVAEEAVALWLAGRDPSGSTQPVR
jgi:hypothetical protein